MKNLLQLIQVVARWSKGIRRSRSLIALAIGFSFLAGVGYTLLIALTKRLLSESAASRPQFVLTFFALCVAIPALGYASQVILLYITSKAGYELRVQLGRQILAAPMRRLEKLGPHRLLATLGEDIGSVIELVTVMPQMLTQFAMMAGCLFYLGWLSWKLLLIMLGYMTLGLLTHQLPLIRAFRYFRLLRKQWDAMYKAFQGLIVGTKELKLNRRRREDFLALELEPAADGLRRYGMRGNVISMASSNWGQILFFVFIGLLLFVTPSLLDVEPQVLVGYTLAVLFLITPLTMILNQIPALERAYLAAERIEELGLSLKSSGSESLVPVAPQSASWRSLELIDVTHTYGHETGEFVLGPVNLMLEPGELVFLIGGNGSGKTTLAKLLMGLYEPESGEIRVDGKVVTPERLDDNRQQFSVVFYDFYLFERLFGIDAKDLDAEGRRYLELLQLTQKLKIEDGKLSTTDLSQGQRKRLALLHAYLEDRPIYIFDEWAADQDPQFKQVFYYQLLPELKARGKTVIVISHDDRYYGLADRVVKLESGKVESDERHARQGVGVDATLAPTV
jgi:putative ATP-binding cassette transporter